MNNRIVYYDGKLSNISSAISWEKEKITLEYILKEISVFVGIEFDEVKKIYEKKFAKEKEKEKKIYKSEKITLQERVLIQLRNRYRTTLGYILKNIADIVGIEFEIIVDIYKKMFTIEKEKNDLENDIIQTQVLIKLKNKYKILLLRRI